MRWQIFGLPWYYYWATVILPAEPTRDADAQYTYTFNGWTPAVWVVTWNSVYTATYSTIVNEFD